MVIEIPGNMAARGNFANTIWENSVLDMSPISARARFCLDTSIILGGCRGKKKCRSKEVVFRWCSFVIAASRAVQPVSRASAGDNRVRSFMWRVILILAILCVGWMVSRMLAKSANASLSPQTVSSRKARRWGMVARFTIPVMGT